MNVKVKKDWKDDERFLRQLGLNDKNEHSFSFALVCLSDYCVALRRELGRGFLTI